MLFEILRFCVLFACLLLCGCQSDPNGSILYDHAKDVILLVKVEIVVVTYKISTFLQFLIVLKLIFFCANNCGMIPWFS